MNRALASLVLASSFVVLPGCEDKPKADETAGETPKTASSTSAGGPPAASASAPTAAAGSAGGGSASGLGSAASASAASPEAESAPVKEAVVTVRDPVAEPTKTVQALPGGSVTVYLPEWAGTKWTVTSADKALGKPKEETIPGFAGPTVPAKQMTWSTASPSLKAGQTLRVQLANTKKGEAKPDKTFALTIELR